MTFILTHWRLFVALAAIVAVLGVYQLGKSDGYSDAVTDQLKQTLKAERERGKDDEKLLGMPDYDLCVVALRRRGLPVEHSSLMAG